MQWRWGRRVPRAPAYRFKSVVASAAVLSAFALAACNEDGPAHLSAAQPRGATVAFESIDGPPPAQFRKLVQDLNDEAQTRRLAVISREASAAYRVRGYLVAEEAKGHVTISWVWDVFDADQHRSLRISGAETVNGRHGDAWQVADDALLRKIAQNSMSELAAFLTSADVAPGTPDTAPAMALLGPTGSSPEAAGIFRIFRPNADPAPVPPGHREAAPAAVVSTRPAVTADVADRR
jgi:hypothetical protein